MGLVTKDVDTLTRAIKDDIPKSFPDQTDYLEGKIDGITEDNKNHFELIPKKIKMTKLDLSIDFSKKLLATEACLGQKIDNNGESLTSVEETLANLLKAQQEQNATNKALMDFLFEMLKLDVIIDNRVSNPDVAW
ncbi:hypothetical protein Dimus_020729 [Dionaea muscipula]